MNSTLLSVAAGLGSVAFILASVMVGMWALSSYTRMMDFVYAVSAFTGAAAIAFVFGLLVPGKKSDEEEKAKEKVAQAPPKPITPVGAPPPPRGAYPPGAYPPARGAYPPGPYPPYRAIPTPAQMNPPIPIPYSPSSPIPIPNVHPYPRTTFPY